MFTDRMPSTHIDVPRITLTAFLSVQAPTKYELAINMKAVIALGL